MSELVDPGPVDADDAVDGRTARRVRNRDAVLDAVLDLFAEGTLEPGAAAVAERSGVSLRSVYRYFDDTDALVRSAIARNLEKLQPLFVIEDPGQGPVADRVERMVAARLRLYEQVAPMMRATLQRAPSNDIIRDQLGLVLERLRHQVESMFEPELDAMGVSAGREVTAALDILLGFHSAEHLRQERGFSLADTRRVLVRAVTALLVPTGD
jgi:AcrR family transcriptional regulator